MKYAAENLTVFRKSRKTVCTATDTYGHLIKQLRKVICPIVIRSFINEIGMLLSSSGQRSVIWELRENLENADPIMSEDLSSSLNQDPTFTPTMKTMHDFMQCYHTIHFDNNPSVCFSG